MFIEMSTEKNSVTMHMVKAIKRVVFGKENRCLTI